VTISRRRVILILLAIATTLTTGAVGGLFIAITHDLPQIQGLETFRPEAVTRIYSADKVLLAELFTQKRLPVPLKKIPDHLKKAIIATEDRHFYEHAGVDLKGIARAIIRDIMEGGFVQGASTITQQISRTLFLSPRKSITRKLKEAFLTFQIERRYTKDEILELYLNQVYFGSGAYGVEAAARTFFGKTVNELDLAECALIAGMPKSPSRYSPLTDKTLALKRRAVVLKQMRRNGVITQEEFGTAVSAPLHLAENKGRLMNAPYFVAYAQNLLERELGGDHLYRTGMTVFTTLNYEMQVAAEKAVEKGLEQVSARRARSGLPADGPPQAALVALDTRQGAILAMVGGRVFKESPFNRATMARRQAGSAFKPLVYACAVENGFAQNYLIWDGPVAFKGAKEGLDWTPENFSKKFKGEMTLRQALAVSQNIPAVKLLNKLGPSVAVQCAHRMGIESPLQANLSLVLGTSEVTLLELTAAYAVFPNGGVRVRPFAILEVVDPKGRSIWRARPQMNSVISAEAAAILTDMLREVVLSGTGRAARSIGRPLAGKTGTTDSYRDALFVGFSPTLAAGVWVGLDRYGVIGKKETGARAALPIWIDFMGRSLSGRPYHDYSLPEGVVEIRIDSENGLLASKECPTSKTMIFKKGTEPKEYCSHASSAGLGDLY
jgi:penicillin-binding protein 1A